MQPLLQHLPLRAAYSFLHNVKRSGAEYLLVCSYLTGGDRITRAYGRAQRARARRRSDGASRNPIGTAHTVTGALTYIDVASWLLIRAFSQAGLSNDSAAAVKSHTIR